MTSPQSWLSWSAAPRNVPYFAGEYRLCLPDVLYEKNGPSQLARRRVAPSKG